MAVTNVNEGTGEAEREDFDDEEGDSGNNGVRERVRAFMMVSWGCADVVSAAVAGSA